MDKVVNTGVTTSGRLYESFLNSQRLIGRVPACAALLLHKCDVSGGRRYLLSDTEMIKIHLVVKIFLMLKLESIKPMVPIQVLVIER